MMPPPRHTPCKDALHDHVDHPSPRVGAALYGVSAASAEEVNFFAGRPSNSSSASMSGAATISMPAPWARHWSKHILGNPMFVPQNMPGGRHPHGRQTGSTTWAQGRHGGRTVVQKHAGGPGAR